LGGARDERADLDHPEAVVTLFLREDDVAALLSPEEAVDVIEECFRRLGAGEIENQPRVRLDLGGGSLALMGAADLGIGYAGTKSYAATRDGASFVVVLFSRRGETVALLEANMLGRLRTGAASGVAAKHLARSGASSLGILGCGYQAEMQVACIRAAVPSIERVVAFCRTWDDLLAFCERVGAEHAETHREAAEGMDVVVTATTARDPVLRGEWLEPGALVCAMGANDRRRRELDNVVLERASFVCCDSRDQAKLESGDLIEPVESGVLDWLEVYELQDVVTGEVRGRDSDDDIVVFKSNGLAAWDVAAAVAVVERARERGVGVEL
jgi:ornithine cyclodeaminase/alanine dehydrogenase-like protein (mu-crystallin family)